MTALSTQPQGLFQDLLGLIGSRTKPARSQEDELPDLYPYRLRTPMLSPVETQFYQVLLAIVGRRVVICPKVRLADVFCVDMGKQSKHYQTYYNRIAHRKVDFLLCERYTLKPLLAIELYDHNQPRSLRKKRDEFTDKVFKATKLPILHLVAQKDYNRKALALRIAPYLTLIAYSRTGNSPLPIPPRCPHCHTPMVRRTVISGQYEGQTYYSCRNYPACAERLPVSQAMAYVN